MTYTKEQLLGLNQDGSSPARGKPRSVHGDTRSAMPVVHPGMEHGPTGFADKNIARDGAPKKLAELKVHDGVTLHTREGDLVVGQTQTALDDSKLDLNPSPVTVGGKPFLGKLAPPVSGQRSRSQLNEVGPNEPGVSHIVGGHFNASALHDQRAQDANNVLANAVQSGATKIPK